MNLQIAVLSRAGDRPVNEDACGYWRLAGPLCCVLSDGAGGHGGGDVASKLSVRSVLEGFAALPELSAGRVARLLAGANRDVLRAQRSGGAMADMRATLVVLAIDPKSRQAIWGHIGDSRLYWLRGDQVLWRSRDHSIFQSLLDAGLATEGDQHRHPDGDLLTAALGSAGDFAPDVAPQPVVLLDGDAFLICSDGLWRGFSDEEIAVSLRRAVSPADWLEHLGNRVIARETAAQDNYSALAIWCEPAGG